MKKKDLATLFKGLVLFLFFMAPLNIFAQNLNISGTVLDTDTEPLIGVTIQVQGTSLGTVTDYEGNFALTNIPSNSTLEITYIGMISQVINVDGKTSFSIVLEPDIELLEEIVVVGYGTTKRKNFTGSVSTVNTSEGGVSLTAPTSAVDMLRGLAPGLNMSQTGVAGGLNSITIRGQRSIHGGSDPLLVVNGVIFKGNMNDIDPATVETMSVLKDATSLAAYGSQAANGVIMITTKKGEQGKPMISFNSSLALSGPNYKTKLHNGESYIELINLRNGTTGTSWLSELEQANYNSGKETDWVDFVTRTGVRQQYSLNISGGTESMNYNVGASHLDIKNFIKGNPFIRQTVNTRVNTKINQFINVGFSINYANMNRDGVRPATNRYYSPYGEAYMPDGSDRKYLVGVKDADQRNPMWNVNNGVDAEFRNNSITLGGELEVLIPWISGLSYKLAGSFTNRNSKNRSFYHELNFVTPADEQSAESHTTNITDNYLAQAYGTISNHVNASYVYDNILTYTKEINKHWLNASFVYTRDSDKMESNESYGADFSDIGNTTLGFYGLNNAKTQSFSEPNDGRTTVYTLHNNIGYLGRLIYSYDDTYHFNASIRRDGSSVFGGDKKWGNFPAIGVAWTVSNEKFWKDQIKWANNTKFKLSWGRNGNQSLYPYQTLTQLNVGKGGGDTYYFGNIPYYGQSLATLGNPALGWETTDSWNFGLESNFLQNNRLYFEVDFYVSNTTDQIFERNIPTMGAGISTQYATVGKIGNWGIESVLQSVNIRSKDFSWISNLQFTLNRNKLKKLYGGPDEQDYPEDGYFIGKSLGAIYGYKFIGVVQEDDAEYMSANPGTNPGDPKYENTDGSTDGSITPADRTILGYIKPSFQMNLSNTFTYKNWALYFLFNGTFSDNQYGVRPNNGAFVSFENMKYVNNEAHPWWTPENKSNKHLSPTADISKFTGVQKYGFVRLQDINISYSFQSEWLKKSGIDRLQLYLSGSNLFFIAPHWEFSDPEVYSSRSTQLARSCTFGLNLRF